MAFGRKINLFLIVLLLGAQLALAQHATVHFTEDSLTPIHQEKGHHPDTGDDKFRHIHFLADDFHKIVVVAGLGIAAFAFVKTENLFVKITALRHRNPAPYAARAPPAFLI